MKFLLAQKLGMTTLFDDEGAAYGVTVLQAGPCVVTQVKTAETDGYDAVQLGFGESKKMAKSQAGQLKRAKAKAKYLAEYRPAKLDLSKNSPETDTPVQTPPAIGTEYGASEFTVGDKLIIRAVTKGKGFAGTIKRHNFSQGPKTHGSHNYRRPGSIGAGYPEHVFKGQKMAGQMGGARASVKNLPVVKIDPSENLIAVKGAVPGPKKGLVTIEGVQS